MSQASKRILEGPLPGPVAETAVAQSWTKRLAVATITAVAVAASVYFPDRDDGSGAVLGGLATLVAVVVGLIAVSKARSLPKRSEGEHVRLAALALVLGVGLGVANLAANYGMALLNPAIYEQMVTRWAEFSAWSIVVEGPVTEEIVVRLLLMSGIAWVAARFVDDHRMVFFIALGVSSLIFGVAHIFYGGVDATLYQVGIAAKTSTFGLLLGWLFWRWGLPYSILCHCMANAVHLLLWPLLF